MQYWKQKQNILLIKQKHDQCVGNALATSVVSKWEGELEN